MNRFNRFFVIISLLIVMAGSAIILVLLVNSPEPFIASLQAYLDSVLRVMTGTSQVKRQAFGLGLGLMLWLCLGGLLWLVLRKPITTILTVRDTTGQKVKVDADLVRHRLIFSLHRLADVQGVEPTVQAKRGKITVTLKTRVESSVSVAMKRRELEAMTQELLEEQMGLQAGRIEVSVEQAPAARANRVGSGANPAVRG